MERNNIDGFLGCAVKLRVAEGIYEGIIFKIDRDLKRITLKNGMKFSSRLKFSVYLTFMQSY